MLIIIYYFMHSIKDNYIFYFICLLFFYLIYRYHVLDSNDMIYYDLFCLFVCSLFLWYLCFSYKSFVFTTDKLSEHYFESNLNYYLVTNSNDSVDRVYVSVVNDDIWYELDYLLCIPRGCSLDTYRKFIKNNVTVRNLLDSMNRVKDNSCGRHIFLESEYKAIKWGTFCILLVLWFIFCLIFSNEFNGYDYYYVY